MRKSFWLIIGLGLACLIVLSGFEGCCKRPVALVRPPAEYEFTHSIVADHQSVEKFDRLYSESLAENSNHPEPQDTYGQALTNQTLGLVHGDASLVAKAQSLFARHSQTTTSPKARQLSDLGVKYAQSILSGTYGKGDGQDQVVGVEYGRIEPPSKDFGRIVIGESAVRVGKGAKVKTQVDRVVRDWLLAYNIQHSPGAFSRDRIVTWHEGAKVADLVDMAGVEVVPVWGTRVRRIGDAWFAPDARGAYRFEISRDKVFNCPTAIVVDERTAILNDTHGIGSIAWDCLDADLVIGCGDHKGKIDAAHYLAEQGVNVYVPTDRYLSLLMGTRTKGTVLGSAPIKKTAQGAVIGDQAISIDVGEPIVVSTARKRYPLQYYDTAYQYFKALEKYAGKSLSITAVEVSEYGKAMGVVEQARTIGAKVIGMRVHSREEHDAVHDWLKEDAGRRAVLFHTAVYPEGYRLFFEFPRQTSFGDVCPRFE